MSVEDLARLEAQEMKEAEARMQDEETTESTEEAETPEGKLLTEEEVAKRIEAARKQEKDKLYSKIEDLSQTVTELSAKAKAEQEAKEAAEQAAAEELEKERLASLSAEDKLAEKMKHIEEQLAVEAAERERLEQQLAEERELAELEAYRQELLQQAGEDIIPDLVRGNSRTEVENSVAYAKARYQELFQATKAKAEGVVTQNMPGPTNPDPAALDEADLQKSIADLNIDPKRYARDPNYRSEMDEKREAVLDQVGQLYKQSVQG